ncbi:MAG: O-antigen ligase family protein [Candidatus Acidiferrum sp.]
MRAIRFGICALVVFAVLSFGGVKPLAQAIVEVGAAILLVIWGIFVVRQRKAEIHWSWLYLPILGIGVIAFAQLLFGLSIYPYLTKVELLRWFSYCILFFLMLQCFRTGGQITRFAWFLVVFGFVVSLFGIIQHFAFNGKLYWLVTVPTEASPFGPFFNRDHFAGFVELTVPLGLALLLFPSRRRDRLPLLLLFTIVPVGALLLSASRGGILGLLLELVLLTVFSRIRLGRKQVLGAAGLTLVAASFAIWLGVGDAIERFEQLGHGISNQLRVSIYSDTLRIFLDHPWLGTGLGTLLTVYPRYASFYNGRIIDHAHNDYLELLADTGLVGGLFALAFVTLVFWRGLGNLRSTGSVSYKAVVAGSLAGCAGLLLHSLFDFNLHIPSNAMIFLLLSCIATADRTQSLSKCSVAGSDGRARNIPDGGDLRQRTCSNLSEDYTPESFDKESKLFVG